MAWFLNHYHCLDCNTHWSDEWSCGCDDDCPECGSRHWSPYESDDLTEVVMEEAGAFVVLRSSDNAGRGPNYRELARFTTSALAMRFVVDGELT